MLSLLQAWLNDRQAVVGTKCNHLLLLNTDCPSQQAAGALQDVPLPVVTQRPVQQVQARPSSFHVRPTRIASALWSIRAQLQESPASNSPGNCPPANRVCGSR